MSKSEALNRLRSLRNKDEIIKSHMDEVMGKSPSYYLGCAVGSILLKDMPVLSTNWWNHIDSYVVEVSDEDAAEYKATKGRKEKVEYRKKLVRKYIPETFTRRYTMINYGDLDEFKEGISDAFYASDCSDYCINPKHFDVEDEHGFFLKFTFKRGIDIAGEEDLTQGNVNW